MLQRIFTFLLFLSIIALPLYIPSQAAAATFRSSETLTVLQTLPDLYATGSTVNIAAPVINDLTVAGGTINLEASVSGGLLAAGGTLNLDGDVMQSLRAAGGTITLTAPVRRDTVLAGGTLTLTETASISGDLIVAGGTVNILGPVAGNVYVQGGQVVINNQVGGSVSGNIEHLVLGNQAVIEGNLDYSSPERAVMRDGAVLKGIENFKQVERSENKQQAFTKAITSFTLYKLIADILAGLALVYLLYAFTSKVTALSTAGVMKTGVLGFLSLIVMPVLGFFLLILILPGFLTLFAYLLLLILAAVVSKLLLGRILLTWWYRRSNTEYVLDWKAAITGPLVMFILLLIPVIGWFLSFLIYILAFGTILLEMYSWISSPDTKTRVSKTISEHITRTTKKTVKKRRS